ncbi:MAG: patatin family protein [bacterium]|nr:patatin family protein [bacterium]
MELQNCSMVLEGGAARGLFTAGVLDYLMEKDFYTKYVVGVSAGACNAVDYVSKQIGRTRDCFIPHTPEEKYLRIENVFHRKPIYDMDLVFDKYPNEIHPFDFETYFASNMECEMVVTNCETGRAEYMEAHEDKQQFMKICRASSSMPLFTDLVEIEGSVYMDGGIADSVPLRHAIEKGYRKHIVVLTKEKGYRKKNSRLLNLAAYQKYQKYPEFVKAVIKRPYRYNKLMDVIDRLEAEGKIFVLRPQQKPVSRLETDESKLLAFYQHGYEEMERRYEALLQYLGLAGEK